MLVEEVRKSTGAAAPSADGLLRVRGVIEEEDEGAESEEAMAALDKALDGTLDEALKALVAARAAEGKALGRVIDGHVGEIDGLCKRAAERAQAQIGTVRARFDSQLAELLERAPPLSEERFAQEVALLVGKADVREELDRLAAHIAQARTPAGRGAAGQSGRPQVRFPLPGVQPRGQYAVLEVGRHRADAHRHRSEGRHRAHAGAGAECRMRPTAPAIQRRGLMLVLSSPSGAGKTTLSRQLLDNDSQIQLSVSCTTRARSGPARRTASTTGSSIRRPSAA